MLDIQRLKRLEDLQIENLRLNEKLSELALTIARLKLAEALAALRSSRGSEY